MTFCFDFNQLMKKYLIDLRESNGDDDAVEAVDSKL